MKRLMYYGYFRLSDEFGWHAMYTKHGKFCFDSLKQVKKLLLACKKRNIKRFPKIKCQIWVRIEPYIMENF